MTYSTPEPCSILVALATLAALGGCGGATLLKELEPLTVQDAPSPIEVRIDYTDASGRHSIVPDTKDALAGSHQVPDGS